VPGPGKVLATVALTALAAGCSAAATAGTTTTGSAVTQATVTGYKSGGSPAFPSSDPVTVVLRGTAAAGLEQVLNGLPNGGSMQCMENVLLYNITFALSGSRTTIDVAGYACVAAVQVTENGKTTLRTDSHCDLLAAVRSVLPASAVATKRAASACGG
jgi:hypothetical protein